MTRQELSTPGALRARALDAARILLEERGAEGLHLRVLAERIGSGVASLYYHFADKDALLAALAIHGWGELAGKIERAIGSGKAPSPIDAASAGLLSFIRRHPQLYGLMQRSHAAPEVRLAERKTFALFRTALDGDPRAPAERAEEIAMVFWVLGRGIASAVQTEPDPAEAERLIEQVLSGFAFLLSPRLEG